MAVTLHVTRGGPGLSTNARPEFRPKDYGRGLRDSSEAWGHPSSFILHPAGCPSSQPEEAQDGNDDDDQSDDVNDVVHESSVQGLARQ